MPKRTDISKILLIGSGPIVIGQACEFDYSGTQACKALLEEGYEVVLVNSNPATIMTDPEFSHRTYIEPITPEILEKIIEKEKPDALLPTVGGQTALNVTVALHERGILDRYQVELIGAKIDAIQKAEDRQLFKEAMERIGLALPRSGEARSLKEAERVAKEIGYPLISRPAFTLGGTGGGIIYNAEELAEKVQAGLSASQIHQVLLEESVLGWKEFELEVMRDLKDRVVIICSIENIDPMGVHTGDSITVAPAQTLTDKEYQRLRDYSIRVIREIGVDTGGSNIQFAVHPEDGRVVVIEMNPRVSRSSALASKATGFPIAKIAAKLAVGYTLDEIPNDITQKTPACFEPTIDYVVTKVPRWAFEKFPGADQTLNTQMKSVGEAMAIGRTFKESLQKALRSLEIGVAGLEDPKIKEVPPGQLKLLEPEVGKVPPSLLRDEQARVEQKLSWPNIERLFYVKRAFQLGLSRDRIAMLTRIDPWFLDQIEEIVERERENKDLDFNRLKPIQKKEKLEMLKRAGFSDEQLAKWWDVKASALYDLRKKLHVLPVYKSVDTCGGEFPAMTPYFYSTYETEDEVRQGEKPRVMILGGGPNRIGQGIEFDYCCVHAAFALRENGYETILVNSNPETVSTDYDTVDRLYFEPVTFEDVMHIVEREKPMGVIVQLGGQTPLKLALPLAKAGVTLLGTSADSIDIAEDRGRFGSLLKKLKIPFPESGMATSYEEAQKIAAKIGYPVMVRPSYVLGGRAMEIVYDDLTLLGYMREATDVSPDRPILVDRFLEGAVEVDVDCVADGEQVLICGIMEHIEEAGVHSGDSACVLPPTSLSPEVLSTLEAYTVKMAKMLRVRGLMNVQYAVKDGKVLVLEVNPRASRTVPFVSKATGVSWAKVATLVMVGKKLADQNIQLPKELKHVSVKEVVLPFARFTAQDIVLGPEMRSTGEVMGMGSSFGEAFAKAQLSAGERLPSSGKIFISIRDKDKQTIIPIAKRFVELGFGIVSTKGTAASLLAEGLPVEIILKIHEGRPNVLDAMKNGEIQIVVNTPLGKGPRADDYAIRREALMQKILCVTTLPGAQALANALFEMKRGKTTVHALQDYFPRFSRTNRLGYNVSHFENSKEEKGGRERWQPLTV